MKALKTLNYSEDGAVARVSILRHRGRAHSFFSQNCAMPSAGSSSYCPNPYLA